MQHFLFGDRSWEEELRYATVLVWGQKLRRRTMLQLGVKQDTKKSSNSRKYLQDAISRRFIHALLFRQYQVVLY
jgi:hypothetical protein